MVYIDSPVPNELLYYCRDSFTRREKAQEDYYIKQREKERLSKLREKLAAQRKHLDDLEEDM